MTQVTFTARCIGVRFLPRDGNMAAHYMYEFKPEPDSMVSSQLRLLSRSPGEYESGAKYTITMDLTMKGAPEGTWYPNSKVNTFIEDGNRRHVGCGGLVIVRADSVKCSRCGLQGELVHPEKEA